MASVGFFGWLRVMFCPVSETLPLCKIRSLGERGIELSCAVTYSGFWAPIMTWQTVLSNGQTVNLRADDVMHSNSTVVTSSVVVSDDRLTRISCIRCRTHFSRSEGDRLIITNASNPPTFVHTWNWSSAGNETCDAFKENELPDEEITLKLRGNFLLTSQLWITSWWMASVIDCVEILLRQKLFWSFADLISN